MSAVLAQSHLAYDFCMSTRIFSWAEQLSSFCAATHVVFKDLIRS
jgi:hypothetical protein